LLRICVAVAVKKVSTRYVSPMSKTFRAPRHYLRLAGLLIVLPLIALPNTSLAYGDGSTGVTTITSTSASSTSITLNWSVSQDTGRIAGFDVMGGPGQLLASFYPPDLTGTVTGLTPSTTYNLTFTTFSLAPPPTGAVFTTDDLTVTTLPPGTSPPSTVAPTAKSLATAIHSITTTSTTARVSWTPASGAIYPLLRFAFYVCRDSQGTCRTPVTVSAGTRAVTIRGLDPRTSYQIDLQTYLGSGIVSVFRHFSTK
jgi:hypothetical protein